MNLAVPFHAFLCLAKLDVAALDENQALQDDATVLKRLHRALAKERKHHLEKKADLICTAVETVLAVVICINAVTLGMTSDFDLNGVWFGTEIAFTTFYVLELVA